MAALTKFPVTRLLREKRQERCRVSAEANDVLDLHLNRERLIRWNLTKVHREDELGAGKLVLSDNAAHLSQQRVRWCAVEK